MALTPVSRGGDSIDVSSSDHSEVFDALYIGVTGDVEVTKTSGTKVTYPNVPVGWMPVSGTIIHTANTTATSIITEHFDPNAPTT